MKAKVFFFLAVVFQTCLYSYSKVVIWGYELNTHTHSYIHNGFYKAFKSLDFDVLWLKDQPVQDPEIFKNTLVFCSLGQAENLPLRNDAFYIVHCRWEKEYTALETKFAHLLKANKCLLLKCFTKAYLPPDPAWEKLSPYIYYNSSQHAVAMPWATDLLPYEIDENMKNLPLSSNMSVVFFGTISNSGYGANLKELTPYFDEAKKHGYSIKTNDPWAQPLDPQEYENLTKLSAIAPAIQGEWQVGVGYIPCRIFKNISYGILGITNSETVYNLFNKKIVYDKDGKRLCQKAIYALNHFKKQLQEENMKFVRDHHTYINRVKTLLSVIEKVSKV